MRAVAARCSRSRAVRLLAATFVLAALPAGAAEPAKPARIVSAGAAITETVIALGAGAQLVGVDTTSELPPDLAKLPKVGYLRTLGAEGLLSLSPTLVLLSDEAGPPGAIEQVRGAGVRCEVIASGGAVGAPAGDPAKAAAHAAATTIRGVAAAVGEQAKGEELVRKVEADLKAAIDARGGEGEGPATLFVVHPPRAGAALVAGAGTPADVMLTLAGARNVATGISGYRPMTPEAAVAAAPEVVVVPAGTVAAAGGADAFFEAAGLSQTPAAKNGRLVEVQPWMIGFGPKTGQAVGEISRLLRRDERVAQGGPAAAGSSRR